MKKQNRNILIIIALILVFLFRLLVGFSKFAYDDEFQIYLIGLKFYTTGLFPYWGPDVVYTQSQIPGGMMGLLVGLPFYIAHIPEAPYLFLNLLSFVGLVFFSWYVSKRVTSIPKWFIWIWLLTSIWTVQYSTFIINPSYVLFPAILFFIGIFELFPIYSTKIISEKTAFFFLGFSLFWIFQIHMSWVLMLPYIALAFYFKRKELKVFLQGILFFCLGSAISISTLIPVMVKYGNSFTGNSENNVVFHPENLKNFFLILGRFIAYSCYELTRVFYMTEYSERPEFYYHHVWIIPIAAFLLIAGIAQGLFFVYSFFRKKEYQEWKTIKYFTLLSFLLVYISFAFSVTSPMPHTFYLMLPVSMFYSFYCYGNLFKNKIFKRLALVFVLSGIIFQLTFALVYLKKDRSFLSHRDRIVKAIKQKDYIYLGIRRESKFEIKNREYIWERQTRSNNAISYFTSFEPQNCYTLPQNIVKDESYSGNYSCIIDSLQEKSFEFCRPLKEFNNNKKISLSCFIKNKTRNKILLVVEINRRDTIVFRYKYPLPGDEITNKWQNVRKDIFIPDYIYNVGYMYIYFIKKNKSEGVSYIDHVEIELK